MIARFANLYRINNFGYVLKECRYLLSSFRKISGSKVLDEISGDFKNISDDEWEKKLSPLEFAVCRKAGTEHPNTGKYNSFYASGTYRCVCCGSALFSSESKFNSGSGWPSFHTAITNALEERHDESHGMVRTEVRCAKCDAHLGHVFKDGPLPTGDRYCINSVCMTFEPKDNTTD
ncbi:hypothetical protein R5R35_002228 [Gryllus longicercus]|uniref:Peptide-methionine (R)-S-oxide reductase n=1 Tax=Gryllus longicercus TaxID=2509291 RepID=A0AAN9V4R7_9ORTH